jgi:hypothetical protein
MASSSKRKQTMAKLARQRSLQEKREAKQLKKDERKRLAAERKEEGFEPATEASDEVPASDDEPADLAR